MASKVIISKKFDKDVIVIVESESNISVHQAMKDALEAIESVKKV